MDFRELSYIVAVAKHQNITKAAESLYVGQPTLTKCIQNLEAALGQKLFRKLGNKFVLTYAGEVYVGKAEQMLLLKKEMDDELTDIIKSNVGILRVGFPVMRGTYMLPCTIPIFYSLYPKVKLDIVEANSDYLEELLRKGEIDIAFFNLPIRSREIDYEVVKHEELLVVLPQGHPLEAMAKEQEGREHPWIPLEALREEKFILFTKTQRTRQIVDGLFTKAHIKPSIFLETRNFQAALTLAARGYGACFVSDSHIKHVSFQEPPLCLSVGEEPVVVDFVAAFRRNAYIPYHAGEYIKIVRDFT